MLLFHQEDMGIQRDVAKLGVRQGMWGAVKKIAPGVRSYSRAQGRLSRPEAMSRSASMARLHTPIPHTLSRASSSSSSLGGEEKGKMRKWVSLCDLNDVTRATSACGDSPRDEGSGAHLSWNIAAPLPEGSEGSDGPGERPSGSDLRAECTSTSRAGANTGEQLSVRRGSSLSGRRTAKGSGYGWMIGLTALAFVCGLEAGLVAKIALAGAVKHQEKQRTGKTA